jgi:hypothetical protein
VNDEMAIRVAKPKATPINHFSLGLVVGEFIFSGLTKAAKRPRLHRDDERSRDSKMLRENGRQCRRGPT